MTDGTPGLQLNPIQTRTLELLRRRGDPVVFDPAMIEDLRRDATDALAQLAERLLANDPKADLYVSKHRLSSILGCEVQALIDEEFVWNHAIAGGQVAHRAIQLGLNWRGQPEPAQLVDEALAKLSDEDTSIGDWIAGLGEADRSDLRGEATERVTKFMECFPPLDQRSRPMTEARLQWPLSGTIILAGKVDLVIGRVTDNESRKVIVDLKTGRPRPQHRDDLRFYALIETLRSGVPPRKLASYYLDAADAETEDVTEQLLRSALRRTLDGIDALIALQAGDREPVKRPGGPCHWCPLQGDCAEGQAYLAEREDY